MLNIYFDLPWVLFNESEKIGKIELINFLIIKKTI